MMFEVPAFGPFRKKSAPEAPQSEKVFSEMSRAEREQAMRDELRKSRYRETKVDAGEGIIVGGEPETYPIEETEVHTVIRDDGILIGEDEPEYSVEQKIGFMEEWSEDLSGVARGVSGSGRAGASLYETSTGLLVEWDGEGVRPVWIKMEESGDSLRNAEVREFSEIAESFPLSAIEAAFDGARVALESVKKEEERRKNGPQPPVDSSVTA